MAWPSLLHPSHSALRFVVWNSCRSGMLSIDLSLRQCLFRYLIRFVFFLHCTLPWHGIIHWNSYRSGQQLLSLITDILDFSKVGHPSQSAAKCCRWDPRQHCSCAPAHATLLGAHCCTVMLPLGMVRAHVHDKQCILLPSMKNYHCECKKDVQ